MITKSTYKGHPTITINAEDRFPLTMGLSKCKLVLQNLDAIKDFVKEHEPKQTAAQPATVNN